MGDDPKTDTLAEAAHAVVDWWYGDDPAGPDEVLGRLRAALAAHDQQAGCGPECSEQHTFEPPCELWIDSAGGINYTTPRRGPADVSDTLEPSSLGDVSDSEPPHGIGLDGRCEECDGAAGGQLDPDDALPGLLYRAAAAMEPFLSLVRRLERELAEARAGLQHINRHGCERYTRGSCLTDPSLSRDAEYGADQWCDPCIAADALGKKENSR